MQLVVTVLTVKRQPVVWTVLVTGVATVGAGLGGVVGIHFHRHGSGECGFVRNQRLKLSKGPLRIEASGLPCLLGNRFGSFPVLFASSSAAPDPLSNIC